MRTKTLSVILTLAISILMVFPATLPRVHAVPQNGTSSQWAAFGPRVPQLRYTVFQDFTGVFSAFEAGQLDVEDWEIPKAKLCTTPGVLTCYPSNSDFFVTSPNNEFSMFQLDLNHQSGAPFLGVAMSVARTTNSPASCIGNGFPTPLAGSCATPPVAPGTASLTSTATAVGGDATHFQLVINLVNIEEGGATITDAGNFVTATVVGQSAASAIKADDGAASKPTGTYTLPLLTAGAGVSYSIGTTVYSGSAALATTGTTAPVCLANQKCTFTLAVNYNSPSTQKQTVASYEIGRALAHLIDKLNLLPNEPALLSCDDTQTSGGMNLLTPAPGVGSCGAPASSVSAALANADCATPGSNGFTNTGGLINSTYTNPNEHPWFSTTCGSTGSPSPVSLYHLQANPVAIGGCAPPNCPVNSLGAPIPGTCTVAGVSTPCFPSQGGEAGLVPGGYPNAVDLRAACDHFKAAGFAIVPATASCADVAAGNVVAGVTAHLNNNGFTIQAFLRTDLNRANYGTIIADAIQFVFGYNFAVGGQGTICYGIGTTPATCANAVPLFYNIAQVTPIVFAGTTNWNIYTGKWGLTPTPDHLYGLYFSQIASTACGGRRISLPNNYGGWCDPAYDTQANAGEFPTAATADVGCNTAPHFFQCGFQFAATLGATRGMTVAIANDKGQFAALNGWNWQRVGNGLGSGSLSVLGQGFVGGTGNLLDMRQVPGSQTLCTGGVPETPPGCTVNSLFVPGGGNPNLIRRSMAQATLHESPFHATTAWEIEPLIQIYDSMLALNPNTGGPSEEVTDWMTTSHSSCVGGSARCSSPVGTTLQTWNLRNDIFFTDGTPVTADDICFSILSARDVPSANEFASVSAVQTCSHPDQKTVLVQLSGSSPFFELDIGGLLVLPSKLWGSVAGWPTGPYDSAHEPAVSTLASSTASTLGFDPVAAGIMMGSGPWTCNPSSGVSTIAGQASCTQNANGSAGGQALAPGGRILLNRNVAYMRCCDNLQASQNGGAATNLQGLEWANVNKSGRIDQLSVSDAAICFGQGAASITNPLCTQDRVSYWASPLYSSWASGAAGTVPGTVDIGDIATLASYWQHGLTTPFLGTQTGPFTAASFTDPVSGHVYVNVDPVTDPYVSYTAGTGSWSGPYNAPTAGTPLGYFQGCYRVLGTTNQVQCSVDTSPVGPTSASATFNGISATGTAGTGNFAGKTLYTFTGTLPTGTYAFSIGAYATQVSIP